MKSQRIVKPSQSSPTTQSPTTFIGCKWSVDTLYKPPVPWFEGSVTYPVDSVQLGSLSHKEQEDWRSEVRPQDLYPESYFMPLSGKSHRSMSSEMVIDNSGSPVFMSDPSMSSGAGRCECPQCIQGSIMMGVMGESYEYFPPALSSPIMMMPSPNYQFFNQMDAEAVYGGYNNVNNAASPSSPSLGGATPNAGATRNKRTMSGYVFPMHGRVRTLSGMRQSLSGRLVTSLKCLSIYYLH